MHGCNKLDEHADRLGSSLAEEAGNIDGLGRIAGTRGDFARHCMDDDQMRPFLLALILTTLGCSNTAKDPEITTETVSAKPQTAHQKADDKATEDLQARQAIESDKADVKAAEEAEEAKARKATSDQLQANFDAADRRFNELEQKAAKATGTKKKKANAAIAEVKTRETAVMTSIAKLRDGTGAAWESAKQQVDADAAALDKAIDALATTLQ